MRQDDRALLDRALHRARVSAYPTGEFVGQEGFMTASEIRALAEQAGIGPGVTVLDLCCGVAGPGRLLTRELGCDYLGVDASASAVGIARNRAGDLPCRFAIAEVPPLPTGSFDVVLLLETMLAFADKDALVREITASLRAGGRFAFTLEEGPPLTTAERAAMPDSGTVWLTPLDEMVASLERAGLVVTWQEDHSGAHRATAQALVHAFATNAEEIAGQMGRPALDELLAAHRLWIEWLDAGRVRKLALVAVFSPENLRRSACDATGSPAAQGWPAKASRIPCSTASGEGLGHRGRGFLRVDHHDRPGAAVLAAEHPIGESRDPPVCPNSVPHGVSTTSRPSPYPYPGASSTGLCISASSGRDSSRPPNRARKNRARSRSVETMLPAAHIADGL